MSARWKSGVLFLAGGAVVVAMLWLLPRPKGPAYQGRRLASWIETYAPSSGYSPGSEQWRLADNAVRAAGTNAIPTVVRLFQARDSSLQLRLVGLLQKQHLVRIKFVPAGERAIAASRAFQALGDVGKAAVPELMHLYNAGVAQAQINDAFTWIGPGAKDALPLLLRAATNANKDIRANAVWALGGIHAEPELCVPVLIQGLGDTDGWTRVSAAHALGKFGTNAVAAIPVLTAMLPTNGIRIQPMSVHEWSEAQRALEEIDPEAEAPTNINVSAPGVFTARTLVDPP